jgi:chromosome segregation ATPase
MASMQEALEDFDRRVEAMRADTGSADTFEQHSDRLAMARARFAQRLHSTQLSMSDWQTQRASVIDAYDVLRDELEQAERDLMET